jgi:hypothetical protein
MKRLHMCHQMQGCLSVTKMVPFLRYLWQQKKWGACRNKCVIGTGQVTVSWSRCCQSAVMKRLHMCHQMQGCLSVTKMVPFLRYLWQQKKWGACRNKCVIGTGQVTVSWSRCCQSVKAALVNMVIQGDFVELKIDILSYVWLATYCTISRVGTATFFA